MAWRSSVPWIAGATLAFVLLDARRRRRAANALRRPELRREHSERRKPDPARAAREAALRDFRSALPSDPLLSPADWETPEPSELSGATVESDFSEMVGHTEQLRAVDEDYDAVDPQDLGVSWLFRATEAPLPAELAPEEALSRAHPPDESLPEEAEDVEREPHPTQDTPRDEPRARRR